MLYINDLPDVVSNGTAIVLIADDAKCLRVIRPCNNTVLFQIYINHLYDWTDHWGSSFSLRKCESLQFSRKRNSQAPSLEEKPYTLGGHILAILSQKDLRLTATNKLSFNSHISIIVAKANRMLGSLRRHCSTCVGTKQKRLLYLTYFRSHLSYAGEVWAAQSSVSDLRLLEGTQRRATRAILGCNSDPNPRPSYKSRLISLNLLPISYWLKCRGLFFFYKILHGAYNFSLNNFISFATGNTISN